MKRTHLYLALGAAAVVGFGVLYLVRPNVRPSHGVRVVYSLDAERAIEQQAAELGRPLTPTEVDELRATALRQAIAAVRERIDGIGVAEPSVLQRDDQIVVELPGLDDEAAAAVRSLVTRTAKLEFTMVASDSEVMRALFRRVGSSDSPRDPAAAASGIEGQTDAWSAAQTGEQHVDYYLTAPDRDEVVSLADARALGCVGRTPPPGGQVTCRLTGRQILERYLAAVGAEDPALQPGADFRFGYERLEPRPDEADPRPRWRTYYLERAVRLDNRSVASAEVTHDPNVGRPEVQIAFSRTGAREFGELTAAHIGHKLAILLDDRITSAPIIQGAIRGGRSTITLGAGTADQQAAEAAALVNVLRAGSLPAPLREESVSRWGPPSADP